MRALIRFLVAKSCKFYFPILELGTFGTYLRLSSMKAQIRFLVAKSCNFYSRLSNKRTYVRKGILTNCPLCMGLLDSLYDALRVKFFLRNNTNVGKY